MTTVTVAISLPLQNASVLIGDLLPEDVKGAVVELEVYFRREYN